MILPISDLYSAARGQGPMIFLSLKINMRPGGKAS